MGENRYSHIIPYCAQPTKIGSKNWDQLSRYPWRWMISPFRPYKHNWVSNCIGYALDNGAYVYWKKGIDFKEKPFLEDIEFYGAGADFIVLPDIVHEWERSLELSHKWIDRLKEFRLCLVAHQGMTRKHLEPFCKDGIGIFIGGTLEYKLSSINWISSLCGKYKVICHVGRVNTRKRIEYCVNNGAHSFDGSGPARFYHTARITTHRLCLYEHDLFPNTRNSFQEIKQKYLRAS
jgi:hypothetical protein